MTSSRFTSHRRAVMDTIGRRMSHAFGQYAHAVLTHARIITPVEHGNLRASGRSALVSTGRFTVVGRVWFSEPYAVQVYWAAGYYLGRNVPRPSGIGTYWSPRGRPKWLSIAAERVRVSYGPAILQKWMRIQ